MVPSTHVRDWEELAALDPLWAIVPAPGTRLGGWELDRFLESGRADVEALMAEARRLGAPRGRSSALDVGCGVGRHARWLAEEFGDYVGIDVSEGMLERARELHHDLPSVSFRQVDAAALEALPSDRFDLVQCWLVLIHLPRAEAVVDALRGLVRVLAPGGLLVFQVAVHIALRNRLQIRRRLYATLRGAGVPPGFLYRRLDLNPVRVIAVPPGEVEAALAATGGRVLDSRSGNLGKGIESRVYYVTT